MSFQSKERERLVCHAAVLGLLGWYLMMPRLYFTHGHIVQAVRLSDWEILAVTIQLLNAKKHFILCTPPQERPSFSPAYLRN